ncbi:minor tail protein [Ruegeria phage RpAliso]|nr:minor tail protein [Ruegeria phage RpAliso]
MTGGVIYTNTVPMIGFHEVRFPEDVSWGSSGGPRYKTHVFTSHRGYEKRNIEWSQPMMEFDVSYGIKQDDQILRVIEFFNARQGRLFGFRYKNWANFNIKEGPIATGDGYSTRLPLWKFYGFAGTRHYKRLTKIVRGSVRNLNVGGTPIEEGVDCTIDYDNGEIALNFAPGYGIPVIAEYLEFDEPVRFEEDSIENVIEAYNNNSLSNLTLVGVRGAAKGSGSIFSPDMTEKGTEDEFFGQVSLLLNFDDARDESISTTLDHSIMAVPVEFANTASIDTSSYRHGSGSLNMGASGRVTVNGPTQNLSNVPFTLELFAQRPTDGARYQPLFARWDRATGDRSYMLRYDFVRQRIELLLSQDGTDERVVISHPWETSRGYYDYIRIDRTMSGWWILRINGVVKQTARDFALVNGGQAPCSIGCTVSPLTEEGPFQGNIDSLRLTRGAARDETFATVPIPAPYGRVGYAGYEFGATKSSY